LVYARVSTDDQTVSLDAQEAACRAECDRRGWSIIDVIRDRGASAKTLDRPALLNALERIANGEASGLVSAKLDRVTRSVSGACDLIDPSDQIGATLPVLAFDLDTSTAQGRMLASMIAVFAEFERGLIAEPTVPALTTLRAAGKPISRPAVADRP